MPMAGQNSPWHAVGVMLCDWPAVQRCRLAPSRLVDRAAACFQSRSNTQLFPALPQVVWSGYLKTMRAVGFNSSTRLYAASGMLTYGASGVHMGSAASSAAGFGCSLICPTFCWAAGLHRAC